MADPLKILANELADYRRSVETIDEKVAALLAIKASSTEAIAVLERLQAKLNIPDTQQSEGNGFHAATTVAPPPRPRPYPAPRAPVGEPTSTSGLALRLLEKHPEGLKPGDVADRIVGKIKTSSEDPRRVIQNTLINLVNRGLAVKDDDGLYKPNPKKSAE